MGNVQSVNNQHHRLAKPKTNTNSPIGTPKTASPVSVYSKYADFSASRRQPLKPQLTSPVETEFGSNLSYSGDDGIGDLASRVQVRLSSLSRSNSVASQADRSTTGKLATLPGSEPSLASQPQGVDFSTALKILQEVRKNTSPEDIASLHQALKYPTPSPSPDREGDRKPSTTERLSLSLTRRRSLITTPGLATRRSSPTDGLRRSWNSWRQSKSGPRDSKWNVEMMGTSPLTRLAAFNLTEEGRETPTPRATTPGDLDYSHLGSLQLGSLVVTNGAPSPAASARTISRRRSNSDIFQEDDYFTASEGRASPAMWKLSQKRGHSRSKSTVFPQTPPSRRELGLSGHSKVSKTMSRCDSPLKIGSSNEPRCQLEPMRLRLRVVNKSADTLTLDYTSEIPDSSFRDSKDIAAEEHDEGFSDALADDVPAFREEAFRILDGTIFSEPTATFEEPQPAPQTTPISETPHNGGLGRRGRRPTPSKADSGYSSGGSFRASHSDAPKEGAASRSSEKRVPSEAEETTSLYNFEQMLKLPISQKPLPPIPTEQIISAPLPASWEREVDSQLARLQKPDQSVAHSSLSLSHVPRSTTPATSQWTMDSSSSMQKRLQKRRPSMPDLPVVQSCQPIMEGTIPNVPDNVRAKFVRRLSATPDMECLTQTYLSTEHIKAEEATIRSSTAISIEFPSPSSSPAPRPRHHRRAHTEGARSPSPSVVRRSLSFFRSKPETSQQKEMSDGNPTLHVMDLGTIGSTLGRSPCDAAMSSVPKRAVLSPTHPHQLGDALPRAKSMVNMDERTASEFGRMRSRERMSLRPQMPQRPLSYHGVNQGVAGTMAPEWLPRSADLTISLRSTFEHDRGSLSHAPSASVESNTAPTEPRTSSTIRARSTGRGPMVSQLVTKFDGNHQTLPRPEPQEWESYARLWRQRRKYIGEGMRQQAKDLRLGPSATNQRATTEPPEDMGYGRYSSGFHYGYEERGYGIGGSAGTRQLHSAAGRKGMHLSHRFGMDWSDVPVVLQRAS